MIDITATIDSMTKEFGRPYSLTSWGSPASGNTYQFGTVGGIWGAGRTILKAATKAQLLREIQIYREGLRDAWTTRV
jgi:hypothetical protein